MRDKDAAMRRNIKIFRTELFDRLADQAVIEQDGAENCALGFGTVWAAHVRKVGREWDQEWP